MAQEIDKMAELARVQRIARLMDTAFRVPGTRFRLGLDTLIGLVPGIGDTIALLPGLYIVWQGWRLGVPRATLIRMGMNVGLDWAVGSIPILGDIFDAGFKANRRNADLLTRSLDVAPPMIVPQNA